MALLTLPADGADLEKRIGEIWGAVRLARPLLHHLTNRVAAPLQALVASALGASPLMSAWPVEVAALAESSDAILFNLGTPGDEAWAAMRILLDHGCFGKPLLLDPVGVGASVARMDFARRVLDSGLVSVCKGNASEIRALVRGGGDMRGVDAGHPVEGNDARDLARRFGCVAAITGCEDVVSDGVRTWRIGGGSPLLPRLPASGCLAGTSVLACLAVRNGGISVLAGLLAVKTASETAARSASGLGGFQSSLVDAFCSLGARDAEHGASLVRRI